MRRRLRFTECRQLSLQQRVSIKQLYPSCEVPMLFSQNPMHNIHVALSHDIPIAAIVSNFEGHETSQVIRLSKPAYHDRHVFRGLIDHVLYQSSRESALALIFVLQQIQYHNQDELSTYQSLGFVPYHETSIHSLPLIPFEKTAYKNWRIELMNYSSRNSWLQIRNQFSHLFNDPFPMTEKQFHEALRRQMLFYTLLWCHHVIGIVKAQINQGQLIIQEMHIDGDETLVREAVSFLQQKFYTIFRDIDEMHVAITTLQPELYFAACRQDSRKWHNDYFTMIKTLAPVPSY